MTSATRRDGTGIARAIEAAGGLLWLAAVAAIVAAPTDDAGPLVYEALAAGAILCAVGLAGWRWGSLGRASRVAIAVAAVGGVAIAGLWPILVIGILAALGGTVIVAIGLSRGPQRTRAVGIPLLAGSVAAAATFGGASSFAAAFGLGHLIGAAIGSDRSGRLRVWPTVASACAAALAVVVVSTALASGVVRLPSGVTASVRTGPLPTLAVVIDTDMQPDDWLAILYLASEPGIEIRAVTVDGGAVMGCDAGVAIARDILADVGEADVPVACGPPPSPGGTPFPSEWARSTRAIASSIGWTPDDGDPPGTPTATRDAVALLRMALDDGPITIVSLGPPTNVARLLDDPTWDRSNVDRIVQMAGAVDVPGNVEPLPSVEWNAAVDPAALATVLASDIEVVLVSLDGTNHVPIRPANIDRMVSDRSTPAAALSARILDTQRGFAASGDYYWWDVLAAIAARQPDIVRVERIPLRVATDPTEAGRTIRDPGGHEVLVSVDADPDGFERILLDALLGRAR